MAHTDRPLNSNRAAEKEIGNAALGNETLVNVQHSPFFTVAARTHPGAKRRRNEDHLAAAQLADVGGHGRWMLGVADGIGGGPGGELASRVAIETLFSSMGNSDIPHVVDRLQSGVRSANSAVRALRWEFGGAQPGSTLVAAVTDGLDLWVASIGDSRAYICEGTQSRQITVDHSLEQDMLAAGSTDRPNRYRHVLTRSLGAADEVSPDLFGPIQLHPGHAVVLCSDGLYSLITDSEIGSAVGSQAPDTAGQFLVELANERGGHDNISVVIARVDHVP